MNNLKLKLLIIVVILASTLKIETHAEIPTNIQYHIAKSIAYHDPHGAWGSFDVTLHIQEPRLSNTDRFSIVEFSMDGSFALTRNRDNHLIRYEVDSKGGAHTLFDGAADFGEETRTKYRLQDERNHIYAMVYSFYYGLPGTLKSPMVKNFGDVKEVMFNNHSAIQIDMILNQQIFSSQWRIFLDAETHALLGIELPSTEVVGEGERVYFEGEVLINGVKFPRMRHWHKLSDDSYLGSDIIMKVNFSE